MLLRQPMRDLLLATWEVEPARVRARLPAGFEPIVAGGAALVSVACFRNGIARLGPLPVPPYAEVDVRTFVVDPGGAPAVFVFAFFVPAVGFAAAPFGVPVRVARIRVARGSVSARGLGLSARYEVGGAAELGERAAALGPREAAYWWKGGRLRRLAGGSHGAVWHEAEAAEDSRFGPAAQVGLDPRRPDFMVAAERAELRASLPAARV